jgi:hypothetical protein
MMREARKSIQQKLEEAFLLAMRAALNDKRAARKAAAIRAKLPAVTYRFLLGHFLDTFSVQTCVFLFGTVLTVPDIVHR